MVRAVAVGGDVEGFIVVEKLEDVAGWGRVDNGGGDHLIHGFVVRGFGGVMHEAGAAAVDGAGEEGHAYGFWLGYALEGADQIGAFEVL